jgi:hypothetical protein
MGILNRDTPEVRRTDSLPTMGSMARAQLPSFGTPAPAVGAIAIGPCRYE